MTQNLYQKSKNPKKGAELFKGLNLNDYLARREITCPICGEKFEVLTIRHSKLKLKSITNEYRKIYNGLMNFGIIFGHVQNVGTITILMIILIYRLKKIII